MKPAPVCPLNHLPCLRGDRLPPGETRWFLIFAPAGCIDSLKQPLGTLAGADDIGTMRPRDPTSYPCANRIDFANAGKVNLGDFAAKRIKVLINRPDRRDKIGPGQQQTLSACFPLFNGKFGPAAHAANYEGKLAR